MFQQIFDTAELVDEFGCGFSAHTGTTRNIVGRVSHQSENINDLHRRRDVEFPGDLFYPHDFKILVSEFRTVHLDPLVD